MIKTEVTEDKQYLKIYADEYAGLYLQIDIKSYWENKNTITITSEDNLRGTPCRVLRFVDDEDIYMLIPEKLVPRPIITVKPTIVKREMKKQIKKILKQAEKDGVIRKGRKKNEN